MDDCMGKIYKDKGTESISRNLIFDNELSDRARFVYCFMMAKPDNWNFYISNMAKELGYSADTLRKYINELLQRGWLTKVGQTRNERNRFGAVDYIIHETRQVEEVDGEKHGNEEKSARENSVSENFRHGKNPTQKDYIYREKQEIEKEKKDITSTIVDVPQSGGKKKAEKQYTISYRCRLIFEKEYSSVKGEDYYYTAKDAAALKQLLAKIKSKMPDEEKENEDALETNFAVFIHAIFASGKVEKWIIDNLSLPVINGKFNEIYYQLKNGTTRQQSQQRGPSDEYIRSVWAEVEANGGIAF